MSSLAEKGASGTVRRRNNGAHVYSQSKNRVGAQTASPDGASGGAPHGGDVVQAGLWTRGSRAAGVAGMAEAAGKDLLVLPAKTSGFILCQLLPE